LVDRYIIRCVTSLGSGALLCNNNRPKDTDTNLREELRRSLGSYTTITARQPAMASPCPASPADDSKCRGLAFATSRTSGGRNLGFHRPSGPEPVLGSEDHLLSSVRDQKEGPPQHFVNSAILGTRSFCRTPQFKTAVQAASRDPAMPHVYCAQPAKGTAPLLLCSLPRVIKNFAERTLTALPDWSLF
jgi:hypothetical protein